MLFLNCSQRIQRRYVYDGDKLEIVLGTENQYGKPVRIELPRSFHFDEFIQRGCHPELSLDCSDPKRLRIINVAAENSSSTDCYAIITSHRESTERGNGRVFDGSGKENRIEVIAQAIGSDCNDDSSRNWHDFVLLLPFGSEFFVQWSGYKYGHDCTPIWHKRGEDVFSFTMDAFFREKTRIAICPESALSYQYDDDEEYVETGRSHLRQAIELGAPNSKNPPL